MPAHTLDQCLPHQHHAQISSADIQIEQCIKWEWRFRVVRDGLSGLQHHSADSERHNMCRHDKHETVEASRCFEQRQFISFHASRSSQPRNRGHIAAISGSVSEGKGRNRDTKATVEDGLWENEWKECAGKCSVQASKQAKQGEKERGGRDVYLAPRYASGRAHMIGLSRGGVGLRRSSTAGPSAGRTCTGYCAAGGSAGIHSGRSCVSYAPYGSADT
jgi:hypothetical protein